MAEIMLLLVFCLLIALTAMFSREQQRGRDLAARLSQAEAALTKEQQTSKRLEALLDEFKHAGVIDDNWRKLVEARDIVDKLQKSGVDPEQLTQQASKLKDLLPTLTTNVSGADLAKAWRQIVEARNRMATVGLGEVTISDLSDLLVQGAKTRQAMRQGRGEHDWPPIINLSEASGYNFAIGRADLSVDFDKKLKTSVVDQVARIVAEYNVDVVEVIGHTDEQAVNNRVSNLDGKLVSALAGKVPIDGLTPADNAGLGMARAVSVARVLEDDPRLKGVTVLPLSGGQMILPGDKVTNGTSKGDVKERRRIEIRVRRSTAKLTTSVVPSSEMQP
ncbi:hypothetical protein [Labrys neptuniae]